MKIQIKHRWNASIIFQCEAESIKLAVELAVKSKVSLRAADLSAADLSAADLIGADLSAADLSAADLIGADLSAADLRAADLSAANLIGADLIGADLRAADLRDADLSAADLRAADLSAANLTPIRDDLWAVLSSAPREVQGLREALANGKVDGSTYTGTCACLVGTLQNEAAKLDDSSHCLARNSRRPAEMFFLNIKINDTPEKSHYAKLALEWTDQWLNAMRSAFSNPVA